MNSTSPSNRELATSKSNGTYFISNESYEPIEERGSSENVLTRIDPIGFVLER